MGVKLRKHQKCGEVNKIFKKIITLYTIWLWVNSSKTVLWGCLQA